MKAIKAWKTSDGKIFEHVLDARNHEFQTTAFGAIYALLDRITDLTDEAQLDVAEAIVEYSDEFIKILTYEISGTTC